MKQRYGATNERSMQLRFHTQTAGVSLTAQQPEVNIARVAIEALAAVLGGTQSLHTDAFDEALALPTDKAARIALRTQQVIAHETGVAHVADPLGGAPFVEWLTDEVERQAEALFAELEQLGNGSMLEGVYRGIEENWFQTRIAEASADFERRLNDGRRILVGVNAFTEGDEHEPELLAIEAQTEELQLKRLATVKATRNSDAVSESLAALRSDAADPTVNLFPAVLEAVRAYATVGEIMATLAEVFGTWDERSVV